MKKKFINPYKWKKKFKRGKGAFSSSDMPVSIDDRLSLRPSTSLESRWHRNPYQRHHNVIKTRLELLFLGVVVVTSIALCFFHPYFRIHTISFAGLERVDELRVRESTQNYLNGKTGFLFYKNNYFLVNLKKLKESLNTEYSFASISLEKHFPRRLHIEVKEKPPALVYDNGREYILIGAQGEKLEYLRPVDEKEWQIITHTVSSTNELGEVTMGQEIINRIHHPDLKTSVIAGKYYPLVYDLKSSAIQELSTLPQTTVEGITSWYEFLTTQASVPVDHIQLLEGGEEGYVKTKENWGIYIKFIHATDAFPIFTSLLPQIDRKTVQYVDMRYLTRVYWK